MTNDRDTRQDLADFLSDTGSGPGVRAVPDDAGKPPRTRNLRPTFRSTPDPGPLATYGLDRRTPGSTLSPARAGINSPSAPAPGAHDAQGRRAAVQQAGRDSRAIRPAQPADASPAGGDIRRRIGRPPGSGKKAKKQIEAGGVEKVLRHITHPIPVGLRVTVTDPAHPWHTYAGEVISAPEKYGLGWYGQRVKLDGNAGEAFIRPEQTDWKWSPPNAGPALPAAIKKLVPKEDQPSTPSTSKIVPTETERQDARRLFREIGQRFNENRKKSKTAAYAGFRHDLMDNLDTLVMGGAIDLKEATTIITNLEQYTRETEQESTETPATILGRWLRMDAAEVAALPVAEPVEEVVEDEENSEDETEDVIGETTEPITET